MQKNKHNKNEKKLFHPIRLIFLLLIFFSLSFTTITLISRAHDDVVWDDTGEILRAGEGNLAIRGLSTDGEVCEFSNSHSSHDYFISTRHEAGWDSVKDAGSGNHPSIVLECCGDECFTSCSTPCGEIDHGDDCKVYQYSYPCDTCESETVTCNDGTWNSDWDATSCSVTSCSSCTSYSWTCKDNTTRERTRTCYDCVNNQCQDYTETDKESCSTDEVCEDGVCISFDSCDTPCGEIDHGDDCKVYQYSYPCDYCRSTLVECDDGEWSSRWDNTSCIVSACPPCGSYSSWTCEDNTTRKRTRTCYDCNRNQCQSYTDTDTESCSTGEVCEDGVCVDDDISCASGEEVCETNHDDMEPFCYDPNTHDCCESNSTTDEPVICDKHEDNLCNQSDCTECMYFIDGTGGDTTSGSETCIESNGNGNGNDDSFECNCDPDHPDYILCDHYNYCDDHETEYQCDSDPQCTTGLIQM